MSDRVWITRRSGRAGRRSGASAIFALVMASLVGCVVPNGLPFLIGGSPPASIKPSVSNGTVFTAPGVSVMLTLVGENPDGSDLTFSIVSTPSRGTLSGLNNASIGSATVLYTPPATGSGSDSFSFKATNVAGESSAEGTFTINLGPPTSAGAPIAVNQSVYTLQGVDKAFSLAAMSRNGAALAYNILTPPAHGALAGAAPNLIYRPAAGFIGTDTLTFKATDGGGDSAPASVAFNVQAPASYTPPVGVPMPDFGISQTVASVYGSDSFYTHWVDPSHPNATDSSNPKGSKTTPRMSLPDEVPAGSVVVIAGGTFESVESITSAGTAARPIFYRAQKSASPPMFKNKLVIEGAAQYVIVENLAVDLDYQTSGIDIGGTAHHVALRNCDIREAQGAVAVFDNVDHVVVFNNHIHDCGDLSAPGDVDDNGIIIGQGENCWVLDNHVRHCVGSGIVLNPGFGEPNSIINHCYIGRNQVHHVRQSGLWSKQSQDCVFSQNTVWSILLTNHTSADGIGFQYGPERLWILNNRVFDCEYGIRSGSNSVSNPGQSLFVIGNVLHDIHDKRGDWDPDSAWSNAGITLVGGVNRFIHNNTIYNCDAGMNFPGDGSYIVSNNIVANVTKSGGNHIWLQDETSDTGWNLSSNLIWQGGGAGRLKYRNTVYDVTGLVASEPSHASGNVLLDPRFIAPNLGDFHLSPGSPAIDAGLNMTFSALYLGAFGAGCNLDADSVTRPSDGNRDGLSSWDIGAFENP